MPTMAKKKPNSEPNRSGDRHTEPRIVFHLEQELLDALSDYLEGLDVKPNRSEVARVALREFLRTKGFWPRKKPDEEKQSNPEEAPQ